MKRWIIAMAVVVQASAILSAQTPEIRVDVQGTNNVQGISVGRWYGVLPITCPGPQPPLRTIAEALGGDVLRLTVGRYDSTRFKADDQIVDYVRTMLLASPEGGQLFSWWAWSEGTLLQVSMITEWKDGRFGRFDLGTTGGNEYAHFEDHRGCERWGRFLGPPSR